MGFHYKFKKPIVSGVCDECGSEKPVGKMIIMKQLRRDLILIIRKLHLYYHFIREKDTFKIDGMNNIEEVFNELKKLISSKELLT